MIIWFLIGYLLILLAQYVLKPLLQSNNKICKPSMKGTLANVEINGQACHAFLAVIDLLWGWRILQSFLYAQQIRLDFSMFMLLTDIFELAMFLLVSLFFGYEMQNYILVSLFFFLLEFSYINILKWLSSKYCWMFLVSTFLPSSVENILNSTCSPVNLCKFNSVIFSPSSLVVLHFLADGYNRYLIKNI